MSEPFWTPLGGQPVDYEGVYDPAVQYAPGDVVRYRGVEYLAVNPSLGVTPPLAGVPSIAIPQVLARETALLDVLNTAAETALFSRTVPAGIMGTDRMLRLTLRGDFVVAAAQGFRARLRLGGTTLYDYSTPVPGVASGERRTWRWDTEIANLGSANVQYLSSNLVSGMPGSSGGTLTTGQSTLGQSLGQTGNNPNEHGGPGDSAANAAIDTSVDQLLEVTYQWLSASASLSFRRRYACLEIV